jgi:hypothetical protein
MTIKGLNWQDEMNGDWSHAYIHESGHAVMAALQTIRCYGIFLLQGTIKACALIDPLPQPLALSNELRLFLASGSAAERICFGNADLQGSGDDRRLFGNPKGVTFDDKVIEAEAILLNEKPTIERLASRLHEIVKKANGDFNGFRPQQAGMGGIIRDYWVLLCKEELQEELKDVSSD